MAIETCNLPWAIFRWCDRTSLTPDWSLLEERKYLEVRINTDRFELPVLAMSAFNIMISEGKDEGIESLIIELGRSTDDLPYKTVERNMRELLSKPFDASLQECPVKLKDESTKMYFCTNGAIFDAYFSPIAMCSWEIERCSIGDYRYRLSKAILRVDPSIYENPQDNMEKFIIKKLSHFFISNNIIAPNLINFISDVGSLNVAEKSLRIEKNPFVVTSVSEPSIETTSEDLRDLALQYIEEIV